MLVFKKYIAVGSTSAIFVAREVLLLRSHIVLADPQGTWLGGTCQKTVEGWLL